MKFVSAQYVKGLYGTRDSIKATSDDGKEYFIPSVQSDVAPWPEFLACGGVIRPAETPVQAIPDTVSRRQFKMQLEISGLTTAVTGWVASQPPLTQIAFNESGTFNREDEMLQRGFIELGFATDQIDRFFLAAAAL